MMKWCEQKTIRALTGVTCVVFGGSGQIGQYLLPHLCARAREEAIVVFSRTPRASGEGVTWLQGCLPDMVPLLPESVEAIVCLGPLDHFSHWLEQAALSNAPRVVAMSSMSAETKRHSPDAAERELAARLRDSEQRLLARCQSLGSACTILRATLIYGGPGGSLERLSARAVRWHMFPLLRGRGLRQPIHAADLAKAVLAALQRPQVTGVIEAGGGERLSASRMFSRARQRLAPGTVGIPVPGMLIKVRTNKRGMAERLRQDLVADNTHLQEWLGVTPRKFLDPSADGML